MNFRRLEFFKREAIEARNTQNFNEHFLKNVFTYFVFLCVSR
jgi:hypothetical protein